jgi:hypothetical protein
VISHENLPSNHPIILELQQNVVRTRDHNSLIMTEFADNKSRASQLASVESGLDCDSRSF